MNVYVPIVDLTNKEIFSPENRNWVAFFNPRILKTNEGNANKDIYLLENKKKLSISAFTVP